MWRAAVNFMKAQPEINPQRIGFNLAGAWPGAVCKSRQEVTVMSSLPLNSFVDGGVRCECIWEWEVIEKFS